jgi:putative redox protein
MRTVPGLPGFAAGVIRVTSKARAGPGAEERYRRRTMPSTVTVTSGDGLTHEVVAQGHRLMADEPASAGGANRGPTPYELLLAALGSCTSMTILLYARRKGWPVERVEITLAHGRDHARDCADCETKAGYIDTIAREIRLFGPLDDVQRARLLEIAQKCPVHRTLTSEVKIRDTLAPPA